MKAKILKQIGGNSPQNMTLGKICQLFYYKEKNVT